MPDLDDIKQMENAANMVIGQLRDTIFAPSGEKELKRRFTITEAGKMVMRTPEAIRIAEKEGRLHSR